MSAKMIADFALLLSWTLGLATLLAGLVLVGKLYRVYGSQSARFITANAASNLSKKIDSLIEAGVEIIIPAGIGCYPLVLWSWRRKRWEARLAAWAEREARITIILSSATQEAVAYWRALIDRLQSRNLIVCCLDRDLAPPEDATEIRRLDRFHPILIVKGEQPLAMWIENDHPPMSSVAYNVEYLCAKDIIDFQRARFDSFLTIIRRLTDAKVLPPFLKILQLRKQEDPKELAKEQKQWTELAAGASMS